MIRTTRRLLLAAPALLLGRGARAQAGFPSKPVRIIVPYPTGGVSDITARLVAEKLAREWGQPVTVENRSGANGIIGTEVLAKAAPDGHVMGLVGTVHALNPAMFRLPYDTARDLTNLTVTTQTPQALLAAPDFPVNSVMELIAHAKARPGEVNYASFGGLTMELFKLMTGIEATRVPYRGSSQGHPDLMANRVNVMFDTIAATLPHIQAGRMKVLGTTAARRSPQLPNSPTIAEAGVPGFESTNWGMMIAPSGIPAPVLARLSADLVATLRLPDVLERHTGLGAEVIAGSPAEADAYLQTEMTKWGETARATGYVIGAVPAN